jgi:LPXTG-site transpeptidase (sortase) family protein
MKKIVILLLLIIGGFIGFTTMQKSSKTVPQLAGVQSKAVSPTPLPAEETAILPKRLIIPRISVNAAIESVGMDSKGNMDVPSHSDNAAWYNLGYKPGKNGSAVIDGHFDKVSGAPAVFYNLASLKPGDSVQVEESDGSMLSFTVTGSQAYPFDKLPLEKIFNTPGKPTLNLITCDGVFNKSAKNYSNRLVVYTELSE